MMRLNLKDRWKIQYLRKILEETEGKLQKLQEDVGHHFV